MPFSEFERNFEPHRIIVNGQPMIKKSVRPHYPFIERGEVTDIDYDQEENLSGTLPIDVANIREWINKCDDIHGDHCRGRLSRSTRPSFLINVKRRCLVPAEDHPYLTLSYVWGKASCISLTSKTLNYLWTDGSLRQEHLPSTINQALQLAALLGQTYLWVDRLCIYQDDEPRKEEQIAAMADIYANSYLTIIAAEGIDALEPLCRRGFIDSSQAQDDSNMNSATNHENPDPPTPTSPRSRIMEDLSWSLVTSSEWATRGWTFQEFYLSRRKLIFHRNTVIWECHCEAWNEMDRCLITRQCPTKPKPSTTTGLELSPWPDFHRFTRLVCLFNVRYLRYQSDSLNAFEGLLSVFGLVFEGGFISGLPQMVFDAALLWQPYFPMERRRPASCLDNLKADMIPPSWSYFGSSGSIHSEDLVTGFNFVVHDDEDMRLPPTHTIPTIKWSHSPRDGPRTGITVSAAEYRARYQGKHEGLPPGWNLGINTVRPCNGQTSPEHYFWRDSDPTRQRFWYPIPMRELSSPPTISHRPQFLHGKTQLVTDLQIVTVYPQLGKDNDPKRCADALIRTPEGKWVGYIRLNKSIDSLPGPGDPNNTEYHCHLIELSRGSTHYHERLLDRYVEYLYPEMVAAIPRDDVYEFVNVMWIEMVEWGMAQRKAVGRVLKSAWFGTSRVDFDATIC